MSDWSVTALYSARVWADDDRRYALIGSQRDEAIAIAVRDGYEKSNGVAWSLAQWFERWPDAMNSLDRVPCIQANAHVVLVRITISPSPDAMRWVGE